VYKPVKILYIPLMKLITRFVALERTFLSLMKQYRKYYWASAWAGVGSQPFDQLKLEKAKIGQLIIGIHFYQTHPDFISTFTGDNRIRYIMQPGGTFHPKLYLFENSAADWALLLGSGNFTKSAFSDNCEATLLITSGDPDSSGVYQQSKAFVETEWLKGKIFGNKELADYRKKWELYRQKLKGASGEYGGNTKGRKPPHETSIMNWTWREFADRVLAEKKHGVARRLAMLAYVKGLLGEKEHFRNIETEARKFIAGAPNAVSVPDWGYFGSMKGNGLFVNRVIKNDLNISKAMDEIPLVGDITQNQYEAFLSHFQRAFINTRLKEANNLATATRLLSMKRPDTFVCYDSENRKGLCKAFDLTQQGMGYMTYWEDIVLRIRDCQWYIEPHAEDKTEEGIRDARAAFLDSLYYEG
jgi:hypothetical protein